MILITMEPSSDEKTIRMIICGDSKRISKYFLYNQYYEWFVTTYLVMNMQIN